jgi:UDP-glucuronate 4-epimerase
MLPIRPGDVVSTYADTTGLTKDLNYKPYTSLNKGMSEFVEWYRSFYNI